MHFFRGHSNVPVDPLDLTPVPDPRFLVQGHILSTIGDALKLLLQLPQLLLTSASDLTHAPHPRFLVEGHILNIGGDAFIVATSNCWQNKLDEILRKLCRERVSYLEKDDKH